MIDDDIIDTFSPPFNPIAFDKINNIILIQLQWFLGKDHVFYSNRAQPIPEYLTQRYQSQYIAPMIFQSVSNSYMKQNNKEDFLTAIINEAKPYLFSEIMFLIYLIVLFLVPQKMMFLIKMQYGVEVYFRK